MLALTRRQELLLQARRHPEEVVDRLLAAEQKVKDLEENVRDLQVRLALNSRNSSKASRSGKKGLGDNTQKPSEILTDFVIKR